jgi:NADH-quinone oxidoreductase subunit C
METVAIEKITDALKAKFGEAILSSEMNYDFPTITVKKENIISVIKFLKEDDELSYPYLTTLCGIHYPETKSIAVMYQLHNLMNNVGVRLKVFLSEQNPVVATLTSVFPGANWMERETFDFYGVIFEGHPNLKRILNVEDMIIYPLRKEYPLEDQVRTDKNDAMFGR